MLFSRYCERLPGRSTKIGNSARVGCVHCAKVASDLEAQSSEPGRGVDILSSDDSLLCQLGVVEAKMGRDSAPHPVVEILVEAFLPLGCLFCWGDTRPPSKPDLVWDVESPAPLKQQACGC